MKALVTSPEQRRPAVDLDPLTAALLDADPAARVLERAPGSVRLKTGDTPLSSALLLSVSSLEGLAADVRTAIAATKKGTVLRVVAVDPLALGATATLRAELGALQPRTMIEAFTWVPSQVAVEVARGSSWLALELAVKKLPEIADPAALIAERAARGSDADAFLADLKSRRPVVTYAIAALSTALFGLQLWWGNGQPWASGMRMGADVRSLINDGQIWRLLTPMVLHGNWVHLLMNMLALFSFGTFLERFLGWRRYLALYVLAGLGGGIATWLRPGEEVISVGASGGIWGLMCAGAVLVTWPVGRLPELVSAAARKRAWTPVIVNGFYSFQPGIDRFAHFGGGLAGALLMLALIRGIPRAERCGDASLPPLRERAWVTAVALASALALFAAIAAAFVTGKPWELIAQPKLTRTAIARLGASIELPTRVGPRVDTPGAGVTFGALKYDPIAVYVHASEQRLSADQAADPTTTLQGWADSLNEPGSKVGAPIEGFTLDGKFAVRDHGGRLYLHGVQKAADGRRADSYWLVEGDRFAMVQVWTSSSASNAWFAAGQDLPFTLKLDAAP